MANRNERRRAASDEPPPRRWPWRIAVLLLVLGGLVWLTPIIVAGTSLKDEIAPLLLPDFQGRITARSVSLSWLSPVVVEDIEARDADDEPLFELRRLQTEKPLWQLLRDRSTDLGQIWLEEPAVRAELRPGGSNLEDALAPLLQSPSGAATSFRISISDGALQLHDHQGGRQSRLTGVSGEIVYPADAREPLQVALQGTIAEGEESGGVHVKLSTFTSESRVGIASSGRPPSELHLVCDQAPLGPLNVAMRRFECGAEIHGTFTSDLKLRWDTGEQPAVEVQGRCRASQFSLAAAEYLGKDVLRSTAVQFAGHLQLDAQNTLTAHDAQLISDVGNLQIHGQAPLDAFGGGSPAELLAALKDQEFHATGRIDLARLAETLPATLRIREDTRVTSGHVQLLADSSTTDERRAWNLQLTTSDVAVETGERTVRWQQPIVLHLAARESPTGPVIERLTCQSKFLQVTGKGTLDDASLVATADLNQLAEELGRIVDLQDVELAGRAEANVNLKRQQQDTIACTADGKVESFRLSLPGGRPWQEEKLSVNATAAARVPRDWRNIRIDSGQLTLVSDGDSLTATLRQPLDDPAQATWPIHVESQGRLSTWAPRLQSVLPLAGWQLAGDMKLSADVNASGDAIELTSSQCDLTKLEIEGHGQYFREQIARLTATGTWKQTSDTLEAKLLTLATTSWSLRGDDVTIRLTESGPPQIEGQLAFRSDIRRTLAARRRVGEPANTPVRGQASGSVALQVAGGVTTARLDAAVENLVLERPGSPPRETTGPIAASTLAQPLWSERQLKLLGTLKYHHAEDRLELIDVHADATGAKLKCQGTVANLKTMPTADLDGEASYNLAVLVHRVRPLVGDDVRLTGEEVATFAVTGPLLVSGKERADADAAQPNAGKHLLVSPQLQASAQFGWQGAIVYGVGVGPGRVKSELRRGIVDVQPFSLIVSEGRLNLTPRLYLNESPAMLTLDRGPLVENVNLSPQLCRRWLKYVAPLLADATQCQGQVSLTINRAALPLAAPARGDLSGQLTLHGADVRPGPLANSYIALARQIESIFRGQAGFRDTRQLTLVHLDEQQLQVHLADGRVHHEGLTMNIGDVTIRTSGSVGVDQTLDLIAEVPIQEDWPLAKKLLGAQGESIHIPIQGTIGRPQVDRRTLDDLASRLIGQTATRLLDREVNQLLGRLLGPPPADAANQPAGTGSGPSPRQPPPLQPPTIQPPNMQPPTMQPPTVEGPQP